MYNINECDRVTIYASTKYSHLSSSVTMSFQIILLYLPTYFVYTAIISQNILQKHTHRPQIKKNIAQFHFKILITQSEEYLPKACAKSFSTITIIEEPLPIKRDQVFVWLKYLLVPSRYTFIKFEQEIYLRNVFEIIKSHSGWRQFCFWYKWVY